jgi:hypothetical protein
MGSAPCDRVLHASARNPTAGRKTVILFAIDWKPTTSLDLTGGPVKVGSLAMPMEMHYEAGEELLPGDD